MRTTPLNSCSLGKVFSCVFGTITLSFLIISRLFVDTKILLRRNTGNSFRSMVEDSVLFPNLTLLLDHLPWVRTLDILICGSGSGLLFGQTHLVWP